MKKTNNIKNTKELWLDEALTEYSTNGCYPFHMPGHKRSQQFAMNSFAMDITEIDEFDDLHHATGKIKELEEHIAGLYQADFAKLLVNGSTAGNLAAIFAETKVGDHILMARNCHKSVYHAAMLRGLSVHYLIPNHMGQVTAEEVEHQLKSCEKEHPVVAVVITSPTYEGMICDIHSIAETVHQAGAVLMVDSAHGAHLGLSEEFAELPITCGADLCVISLHKTLPALTQTAVLLGHYDRDITDDLSREERIDDYLDIFQTSSPSYVLMASASSCIRYLMDHRSQIFKDYKRRLESFYLKAGACKKLQIMPMTADRDPSKIIIYTDQANLTGNELSQILREKYRLEMEMASFSYVIAMTSVMDSEEALESFAEALLEIDAKCQTGTKQKQCFYATNQVLMQEVYPMYEVGKYKKKKIKLAQAAGCVSVRQLAIYPPGIPLTVTGEEISQKHIDVILQALQQGLEVTGISWDDEKTPWVWIVI